MDIITLFNSFITIDSAIALWVVGTTLILFRQSVDTSTVPFPRPRTEAIDTLEQVDPDKVLPFPMENT